MTMPLAWHARVRALNDCLRRTYQGGRILVTPGVRFLPQATIQRLDAALTTFDAFGPDNDPHDDHDFGLLTVDGHSIMFKIDYYDLDLIGGSPDASDPAVTCRVLTLMLAEEY
ncbi:DUF3768 domain-containing protein [Methylobacterium sp. CM6244]